MKIYIYSLIAIMMFITTHGQALAAQKEEAVGETKLSLEEQKLSAEERKQFETRFGTPKKCTGLGGRWAGYIMGRGRSWGCVMPAPDAGKSCTDSDECQSKQCVVQTADCKGRIITNPKGSGLENCSFKATCHTELFPLKGCGGFMIKGKFKSLCVD